MVRPCELQGCDLVFDMDKPDDWSDLDVEEQERFKRNDLREKYGAEHFWFMDYDNWMNEPMRNTEGIKVINHFAAFEVEGLSNAEKLREVTMARLAKLLAREAPTTVSQVPTTVSSELVAGANYITKVPIGRLEKHPFPADRLSSNSINNNTMMIARAAPKEAIGTRLSIPFSMTTVQATTLGRKEPSANMTSNLVGKTASTTILPPRQIPNNQQQGQCQSHSDLPNDAREEIMRIAKHDRKRRGEFVMNIEYPEQKRMKVQSVSQRVSPEHEPQLHLQSSHMNSVRTNNLFRIFSDAPTDMARDVQPSTNTPLDEIPDDVDSTPALPSIASTGRSNTASSRAAATGTRTLTSSQPPLLRKATRDGQQFSVRSLDVAGQDADYFDGDERIALRPTNNCTVPTQAAQTTNPYTIRDFLSTDDDVSSVLEQGNHTTAVSRELTKLKRIVLTFVLADPQFAESSLEVCLGKAKDLVQAQFAYAERCWNSRNPATVVSPDHPKSPISRQLAYLICELRVGDAMSAPTTTTHDQAHQHQARLVGMQKQIAVLSRWVHDWKMMADKKMASGRKVWSDGRSSMNLVTGRVVFLHKSANATSEVHAKAQMNESDGTLPKNRLQDAVRQGEQATSHDTVGRLPPRGIAKTDNQTVRGARVSKVTPRLFAKNVFLKNTLLSPRTREKLDLVEEMVEVCNKPLKQVSHLAAFIVESAKKTES